MPQYTRILNLGDSETFGARSTHGRTYPQILEERLNEVHPQVPAICINRGVNGERSWEIVNRGVDYLLADPWIKYCVCMMGTNDTKPSTRTPVNWYLAQWDRLKRACVCTDTVLIALEMHGITALGQPEYDAESLKHMHILNVAMRQWANENHVICIGGLEDYFKDNPHLLADGIHPTNDGNDWISERVANVIGQPLNDPVRLAMAGSIHSGDTISVPNHHDPFQH